MFNWFARLGQWIDTGMRRLGRALRRFFWPDPGASVGRRMLPYASLLGFLAVAFAIGGAGWEITNSNEFCGLVCHTMPPQYESFQTSPHARVKCVECHIGRCHDRDPVLPQGA